MCLLVLEPRAHPGVGNGCRDRPGGQARGVVLHVQAPADDIRGERFEADQVFQSTLDERDFLMTVHAFDAKRRLGMHFTRGTRDAGLRARHHSTSGARRALFHVLAPLRQQPDDVVVVEAVEDHAAVTASANEPEAAEEAELMRDGRFRKAEKGREIANAKLGGSERSEEADTRRIAKRLEDFSEALDGHRIRLCGTDFGDARGVGMEDVARQVWRGSRWSG